MTKFKFRLKAALRLRRLRVEAEYAKLQELIGQRARLENSLASIRQERADASAFIHRAGELRTTDLHTLTSFTLGLEVRAANIREAIANSDGLIREARERLERAERDEQCLSKLRGKRLAEWNLQADREIEAMAQELLLFSHTIAREDPKPGRSLKCARPFDAAPAENDD